MKTKKKCIAVVVTITAAAIMLLGSATKLQAVTVVVPGTSDPWLAGMPNGSTASFNDVAPAESPVLVIGITLAAGSVLHFSATGSVLNFPGIPTTGPDGGAAFSHFVGAENGIANATANLNSLVGIFLDNTQPSLTGAPTAFPFSPTALTFSPGLKQPFFIGDGLTGSGTGAVQQFIVPAGATRLFLGTMDGYDWYNNVGSFTVNVTPAGVPESSTTLLLMLLGLAAILSVKCLLLKLA